MDDLDTYESDLGPRMRACSERERAYVRARLDNPTATQGRLARLAGLCEPGAPSGTWRKAGHDHEHRQRVLDALHEETHRRVRLGGAIGVAGLIRIASDPKARGHLKACETLASMAGFVAEQKITVDHTHRDMTGAAMMERIAALAAKLGLDPAALLGGNAPQPVKLIEGEAVDAEP